MTGVWGTAVSGVFLVLIGLINLAALVGILKVFRRMRAGHYDEAELERQLDKRGFLNRILGRVTRTVRKPWHMYPVGLLFGLGFDTVTEVGLLVVAGGAAAANLPWYAVLTLPVLFAAGMSLLDTIDGSFMNFAYGWAFSRPVRKIYYNITVTSLSVAVALVIGVIELVGLLGDKLDVTSGPLAWVGSHRPRRRRLLDRRALRRHLGRGARRVALRAHRGALVGGVRRLSVAAGSAVRRVARRRAVSSMARRGSAASRPRWTRRSP